MGKAKYNDRAYKARWHALRRKRLPCWLCGRPIDYNTDWRAPQSFTADHVEALANGGKLLGELRPAHRACNSRRGKGDPTPNTTARPPERTSIPW